MKKIINSKGIRIILILLSFSITLFSQNKYGQTVLCGYNGMLAVFTDTSRPIIRKTIPLSAQVGRFGNECSNICDSLTGKPLFYCNGENISDTFGNYMDNGSNLIDSSVYYYPNFTPLMYTQGSLILPMGNNKYYVFATTLSDSMFQTCWFTTNCPQGGYYDELRYHIVDMNMNAGAGKVVVKNKKLLNHIPLNRTQMMACRHANGKDWWLLKTGFDVNVVYSFLVTQDSIYAPQIQYASLMLSSKDDHLGQLALGRNGTKYAAVLGNNNILMMADFDRCTGSLSNEKYYHIPIDSTTILNQPNGVYDSVSSGVCFSPNGQFVYVSKWYNVYQFDYDEEDSSIAWYRIKHGPDTAVVYNLYGQMANAPDGRIYIGKHGGTYPTVSNVIDYPNIKGVGCGWCNRCFRDSLGTNFYLSISFANMPDYNLGPSNNPNCWPVGSSQLAVDSRQWEVYPNPSSSSIFIKHAIGKKKELYNAIGQLLYTTTADELDVSKYASGLYYLRCEGQSKKVIIE